MERRDKGDRRNVDKWKFIIWAVITLVGWGANLGALVTKVSDIEKRLDNIENLVIWNNIRSTK